MDMIYSSQAAQANTEPERCEGVWYNKYWRIVEAAVLSVPVVNY